MGDDLIDLIIIVGAFVVFLGLLAIIGLTVWLTLR